MKRREKLYRLRIDILYLCVAILAVAVILLGVRVSKLGTRTVIERQSVAEAQTLSAVLDAEELLDISEPPGGYVYFDVPLDDELQEYIFDICQDYGVDPELIVSMIFHESNFDSAVIGTNDSGYSYGLMQIMPRWNQARMEKLGCLDLLNPYQNVLVGVDLMAEYIEKGYGIEWALMAYNGGPSYANRKAAEGVVSGYATRIVDYANGLCRASESLRTPV